MNSGTDGLRLAQTKQAMANVGAAVAQVLNEAIYRPVTFKSTAGTDEGAHGETFRVLVVASEVAAVAAAASAAAVVVAVVGTRGRTWCNIVCVCAAVSRACLPVTEEFIE